MLSDYSALWKNKKFINLWLSQLLSQITINILNFLILIRVFAITGSTLAASAIWLSYVLPAIIIGPVAATSIDIFNKRKTLMITNLLQSVVILLFALTHEPSIFLFFQIVFVYSFINQFYGPAEQASFPFLLKKSNLPRGNSLFFLTQQTSLIIGFSLAGPISNFWGFSNALYFCSILLFIAFIAVYRLPEIGNKKNNGKKLNIKVFTILQKSLEGYKEISGNRFVWGPMTIILGLQAIVAVMAVNAPEIAFKIFSVPLYLIGVFLVLPASAGAIFGTFYIPRLLAKGVRKFNIIYFSLFFASLVFFAVPFLVNITPLLIKLVLSIMLMMALGLLFIGILVPTQTFLQEKTPIDFRGRVFGNIWFLSTVVTVLPVFLSATISEFLGIQYLLYFLAAILLISSLLLKRNSKKHISF